MAKPKYSYEKFDDHCARVYGRNLPVSTKTSIEMCSFLKGKSVDKAIQILDDVLSFKQAVPFRRFTDGVGHRKGNMASGRYPQKLSTEMKILLNSVKANAEVKGLSDSLKIVHLIAQKASTPFHQGRQRRRAMKRTHIELIVREDEFAKKQTKKAPQTNNVEKKSEVKNIKSVSEKTSVQEGEQQ
ncbi:MAG: 50S ribosomal protein L22 [Candidatus Woesearchaeota archaeon]